MISELFSTRTLVRACGIALLTLAIVSPADAGSTTIYKWRNIDGSLGFADDMKRVPKEYRDQVDKQSVESLSGYAKLTLEDTALREKRMKALDARLAYLQELNQALDQMSDTATPPAVGAGPRDGVSVFSGTVGCARGGGVNGVSVPVGGGGRGPPGRGQLGGAAGVLPALRAP